MVGSFSRIGLSLCTYVPPNQAGVFSDSGALNRAVQRPANAFDAFRRAAEEGLSGVWSGISGTLMDPTQVRPGRADRAQPWLLPPPPSCSETQKSCYQSVGGNADDDSRASALGILRSGAEQAASQLLWL